MYIQIVPQGEVSFNITAFDLAGNNLTADHYPVELINVIIDNAKPVIQQQRSNVSLATVNNILCIICDVTQQHYNLGLYIRDGWNYCISRQYRRRCSFNITAFDCITEFDEFNWVWSAVNSNCFL